MLFILSLSPNSLSLTHIHTEPHFHSEKQGPCWKRGSLPRQLGWALREAASGTKTCHARGSLLCCAENRWELPQTTGPFISPFNCTHKHTPCLKQQRRLLSPTAGPRLILCSIIEIRAVVLCSFLHLWEHAWNVLETGIPKLKSRALHPNAQLVTCVLWAEGDLLGSRTALNPIRGGRGGQRRWTWFGVYFKKFECGKSVSQGDSNILKLGLKLMQWLDWEYREACACPLEVKNTEVILLSTSYANWRRNSCVINKMWLALSDRPQLLGVLVVFSVLWQVMADVFVAHVCE